MKAICWWDRYIHNGFVTIQIVPQAATSASTELQPSNSDGWSTKSKRAEITRDISLDKSREKAREGWTGEAVQPQRSGHPLLEQKEILRGYLRQVRPVQNCRIMNEAWFNILSSVTCLLYSHNLLLEIILLNTLQAIRDNRQEETETLKQNLLLILEEIKSLGLDDSWCLEILWTVLYCFETSDSGYSAVYHYTEWSLSSNIK